MIKAFFWKMLERIGVQGISFILQLILARLLSPAHYGSLSIMLIFIALANVFIQTGFTIPLVQNKNVMEEDYSSVFWITMAIALLMYGIIFVGAPLIADYYAIPDIVNPLRALSLMLIPGALNSVQGAILTRKMDFKKIFLSSVGSNLFAGAASIAIAMAGGGLWALVFQNLLKTIVECIVLLYMVKWYPRIVIHFDRVWMLFRMGWKLLVSGLLDTLYENLSSLVIGKKYDSGTLGYYNRGMQFPQFIINAINGTVQSVMFPAMAAEQDDTNRVKYLMRSSMTMTAYIIFPMMAGLAAVATPLVSLLLTEKWLPCVPYMRIYCFTLAFYPIHGCNLQTINAMGRSDLFLKLEIIKKCYGIVALAIAVFCFDSPLAIAMTALITTWISWFVNSFPNQKLIGYSYKEQLFDLLPIMFMALGMCALVLMVGKWCQTMRMLTILTMLIQILFGVTVYLLMSLIIKPYPYRMVIDAVACFLKKRADASD